jgi:hypothetical protein
VLPTAESFANSLLALTPTTDPVEGITKFVQAVAAFTNQVQAGPTGTPGILTFGNAAMIAAILAMQPVQDSSWIAPFVNAWQSGILTSIIAPGTVTDAVWLGSGSLDTETLPSAAATITTIPAAAAVLTSELATIIPVAGAPIQFATAIRDATLALTFNCIGLGTPPALVPIPILFPAQ